MTALEIYNKSKLSSYYIALEIMEELQSAGVDKTFIPGAIYEAGRQRKKGADPELCEAIKGIHHYTQAEKKREALLNEVAEIRAAAAAGGYKGDPVFALLDAAFLFLMHLIQLEAVQ